MVRIQLAPSSRTLQDVNFVHASRANGMALADVAEASDCGLLIILVLGASV